MVKRRNCKKDIEEARNFTKGIMPLIMLCKTEEELSEMKKAAKGMRGIKNLTFKLKGTEE